LAPLRDAYGGDVTRPVVSFHFGLPESPLLRRVKAAGCVLISSATIAAEAVFLERHGVDAVTTQGYEAGGHRGMFLTEDIAAHVGAFALVPQIIDAVAVPVIAAGGIADARDITAAFALCAAGVQIGSAYMHCPEAKILAVHRAALKSAGDAGTALTNLMTGRPARGSSTASCENWGRMGEAPRSPPVKVGDGRAATSPQSPHRWQSWWRGLPRGSCFPCASQRQGPGSGHTGDQ
jgi:nitronate monooxygenase